MDKLKKYKGITLISLVVTIVILIIIAGISISMLLGNEGLLSKTKYATESYSNAQQEELELAKYTNQINGYVSGNRNYETEIENLKRQITSLQAEITNIKTNYRKNTDILTWSLIDTIAPSSNWTKSTKDINEYKYIAICCGDTFVLNPTIISVEQFKTQFNSSSKYFCSQVDNEYIVRASHDDGLYVKGTNFTCSVYGIK